MKERLENFSISSSEMWICTIHSMCNRILRMFGEEIGFDRNFSIYTEQEKEKVVKKVCESLEINPEKAKKIRWHISNAKNSNLSPEEYSLELADKNSEEICNAYKAYQETLLRNNAMDFDDLICKAYELISTSENAREYFWHKFRYIHVDEFSPTLKATQKFVCRRRRRPKYL